MDCPLTPQEIAELRAKVQRAYLRKPFTRPAMWETYVGGPLDGIQIPTDELKPVGAYHGWCALTDKGTVVSMYRKQTDGTSVFDHYNCGDRDKKLASPLATYGVVPSSPRT